MGGSYVLVIESGWKICKR